MAVTDLFNTYPEIPPIRVPKTSPVIKPESPRINIVIVSRKTVIN